MRTTAIQTNANGKSTTWSFTPFRRGEDEHFILRRGTTARLLGCMVWLRSHRFVLSPRLLYCSAVPIDAELTFADHMGRFYARRYAFPPMVGRMLGYLAVCDPPEQSIGELAEALLASRSAIAGAVKVLETTHAIRRTRVAGERVDRVRIDLSSAQSMGMDVSEYEELGELAREGLEVLRDAPAERRAVLLEVSAFADFLVEQVGRFGQEWTEHRAALVASGQLPAERPGQRR
jgi:hypothetical protein